MPVVVSVIVGTVLAVWLAMFLWSTVRAGRGARHRSALRPAEAVPDGFTLGIKEPEALRAPFAFVLRQDVVDIAQSMVGDFRGDVVGITDLTVRADKDAPPTNHTVATLEVEWRWPWMRLRRVGVTAPEVPQPELELPGVTGSDGWIVEAADPDLARQLLTEDMLRWLARGDFPVQVETTPRGLLVAVDGHVPDDRLTELVTLLTGVVDHVPGDVKAQVAPPRPEDDL